MSRRSKAVSIASTTPRQNRCSARSPSTRRWCWRISTSTKNPTKSRPCRNCWKNSTWRAISSRAMRCIVKKTFEVAAAANAHLIVQLKDNQLTLRQKVEAACNTAMPRSAVQTVDGKKRNSHETRTIAVFDATPAVVGTEWEGGFKFRRKHQSRFQHVPRWPLCPAGRRKPRRALRDRKSTRLNSSHLGISYA